VKKIRLALVSPLPPPQGGIQTWTVDFLEYFKDSEKLDVRLVNQGLIGKRATGAIVKKNIFDEVMRSRAIVRDLKRELKNGCDVVHLNSPCSPFGIIRDYLCVKAAKKHGVPVVFHCRCNIEKQIGSGKIALRYLGKTVRLASTVLVLNESSKKFLENNYKKGSRSIFNFVPGDLIVSERKTNERLERAVFAGNIIPTKGVGELLAAAGSFPEIKFILVGKKAPGEYESGVPDNVVFTGSVPRDRVLEYYDAADVFVFPTYTEGFSIALAEAMARGLPVITTDAGANRDMLCDRGGIIVGIADVGDLTKAIERIKDPEIRREMSEFNLERVRDFTVDKIMAQYLDIYGECIEKTLP
jgi:glycosyltransferase involved in cell wall biosynthesis